MGPVADRLGSRLDAAVIPPLALNGRFLTRPMTGVDRTAQELMRAYLMAYPDSDLLCLRPEREIADRQDRPAVLLDRCIPPHPARSMMIWEQMHLARAQPDRYLLSLCNIAPLFRKRQIVMIHDAQVFDAPGSYGALFRAWYRFALPRIGHRAALILTVSEASKHALIRHKTAPPDTIKIVPNGVDHILDVQADDRVLRQHDLQRGQYFLTIGSQAAHKNMGVLAKALALRNDAALPLVVVGDAGSFAHAQSGVIATGRVSDAELCALYENARSFLIPSVTEGFGLPAGEAMACGCPVISSTGGALPEVCGDAATYADPHDASEWAAEMDRATSMSRDQRQHLADQARGRAKRWTWAKSAQILHQHLSVLPPVS